jgi:hypothetical protein
VHDHAGVMACATRRDPAHPSAAELRRAARPSRLRELLMGVSISPVAVA